MTRWKTDVAAGLTTAAVALPKAMAYAAVAGLPLQLGLYTGIVPVVAYAALGTSRSLSVTTTSTLAILTAAVLADVAPAASVDALIVTTVTLGLLVGAFLLIGGMLRLGFLAAFISDPVLTGFKAGVGVVILVDQMPKLLGVHLDKAPFFPNLLNLVAHAPEASVPTVLVGLATLALIFGLAHVAPRAPAPLVAIGAATVTSVLLGLEGAGVALVGAVPSGLPTVAWPDLSLAPALWPGAAGLALMSFVESSAAGRLFIRRGDPIPSPNRELIALGVANAAGSVFQILPAGGGTSQTAVNFGAGARSQLASSMTAVVAVATLLFLAGGVGLIPQAALAAVVVATTIPLIDVGDFLAIRRIRVTEFRWAVIAFLGVVLLGTLNGVLVAVVVSVLVLIHQASQPPVYLLGRKPGTDVFRPLAPAHPDDETVAGLMLVRTEGRLLFLNVAWLREKVWPLIDAVNPRVLALDMSAVPDIEYTALRALGEFNSRLDERGIELWLVGLNPEAMRVVERAPVGKALTRARMFHTLALAVERYEQR